MYAASHSEKATDFTLYTSIIHNQVGEPLALKSGTYQMVPSRPSKLSQLGTIYANRPNGLVWRRFGSQTAYCWASLLGKKDAGRGLGPRR